jgi:hypothetical protein
MTEQFLANEKLFRGVHPNNWKESEGRPTSACFKDSKGVSVNRALNDEASSFMHLNNSIIVGNINAKAIVSVYYYNCTEIGVDVIYSPQADNPYHSEIHKYEADSESAFSKKAHALAKAATIETVYENKRMVCRSITP